MLHATSLAAEVQQAAVVLPAMKEALATGLVLLGHQYKLQAGTQHRAVELPIVVLAVGEMR